MTEAEWITLAVFMAIAIPSVILTYIFAPRTYPPAWHESPNCPECGGIGAIMTGYWEADPCEHESHYPVIDEESTVR